MCEYIVLTLVDPFTPQPVAASLMSGRGSIQSQPAPDGKISRPAPPWAIGNTACGAASG
jgi:hypothetical protein